MDESISLRELVDADIVQAIQDSFAKTVGVSSVIFLPDGDALTRFSNPPKFCSLIRSTKEGRQRCFQSFAEMSKKALELSEPEIMYCFAYGAHFVAPIIIDGERKATMYAGQFRPDKFSPEQLKELEKIAVEIDLDPESLIEEANKARVVGEDVVRDHSHSFFRTVKVIAELGAQAVELQQTKDALQKAHDELEMRVQERTTELAETNKELRREIAERKAAEDALRESEGKLSAMLQSLGDHISMMDEDLNILWANDVAKGLFGDDIIGRKCYEVYHGRNKPCEPFPCLTLKAFEDGQLHEHETLVQTRAGKTLHYACTASVALRGDEGMPAAIIEISRDITERKAIEEGLKTSSSLLRSTLESTADGILVVDRAGKPIDFNRKFVEMWHIPDSLAALRDNDKLLEFVRDQLIDPDAFLARVRELYSQPDVEVCDVLEFKDGRIFERYSTPYQIDGKTVGSVRSFHDITERERAEEALRKSEERYRALFETAKDAIFLSDETGNFVDVNQAACESLGYSREELLRLSNREIDADPRGYEAFLKVRNAPAKEAIFEVNQQRKDGTLLPVEITGKFFEIDGELLSLAIARDITERKAAEEQIKRSLREKDMLMHEIHHRVKNNLQVVSSLLSMQARTTRNKEAIDVLSKSQSRINTMALIHTQLYESGDLSELNMKEFVGTLSEQLFRSYQVNDTKIARIVHVTDRKFPISVGVYVGLIINELLSNALQHAFGERKDGKIEVDLTAPDSDRVNLRVSDDGVGLPPGFDINAAKTLGLCLVKILVEDQLQGRLEVISDEGVTFNMEFDLKDNGGSSYGEDKNTDR